MSSLSDVDLEQRIAQDCGETACLVSSSLNSPAPALIFS